MENHFWVICLECRKIIRQCRCPSKDKVTYYEICEECERLKNDRGNE